MGSLTDLYILWPGKDIFYLFIYFFYFVQELIALTHVCACGEFCFNSKRKIVTSLTLRITISSLQILPRYERAHTTTGPYSFSIFCRRVASPRSSRAVWDPLRVYSNIDRITRRNKGVSWFSKAWAHTIDSVCSTWKTRLLWNQTTINLTIYAVKCHMGPIVNDLWSRTTHQCVLHHLNKKKIK